MLIRQKSRTLSSIKNLFSFTKMIKEILTFRDMESEKNKFYCNKNSIFLKEVDIEKVLLSSKDSFGEKNYKYFSSHELHKNMGLKVANIHSF